MAGGNISLFHQERSTRTYVALSSITDALLIIHILDNSFFVKVENCSWFFLLYSMIGYDNYFPCTIEVCFGIYIGLDNRISNKHFFK